MSAVIPYEVKVTLRDDNYQYVDVFPAGHLLIDEYNKILSFIHPRNDLLYYFVDEKRDDTVPGKILKAANSAMTGIQTVAIGVRLGGIVGGIAGILIKKGIKEIAENMPTKQVTKPGYYYYGNWYYEGPIYLR